MGDDFIIVVNDFYNMKYCRICHETEFETCSKLEAPCSCSGSLKFAHRECIQKWCDEKGDTICEICLQKYETGYTAIPKQPKRIMVRDEVISIRESIEIPREFPESESTESVQTIAGCALESDRSKSASCCRTLALICTTLLMLRHLLDVLMGGTREYPFSTPTVLLLRSCGIVIPMYVIIWTITSLLNSIKHEKLEDALIQVTNNNGSNDQGHLHWQR